ncbi:MAG TPA: EAL domain-containing protein [Telluria sp.]|nr:EAL domain-containing protein [Telluria sp.]
MRQSGNDRLQAVLALLIVIGSGALLAATLALSRTDTMAAETTLTRSIVAVVAEQSARTIQNVDQKLQFIGAQLGHRHQEGTLGERSTDAALRVHLAGLPFVRALWVLSPAGRIIADTDTGNLDADLADRDYFAVYRQQPGSGFYLGAPVRSRSTGTWLISAAYPVRDVHGALAGVVVAALEPPYFEKLWGAIDLGAAGQIDLYRADGILMASSKRDNPLIGQRQRDRGIELALARGAASTSQDSDTLMVTQPLGTYPQLTLAARRSLADLLQQWRRFAMVMGGAWLLLSLMVVALFVMRRRSWLRQMAAIDALQSSERKFAAAFRASPDAIMITRASDGMFVEVSESVSRMTGFAREDLIGRSSLEHDIWVETQARQRYIGQMRAHGRVSNMEARFRIRSGEQRIGEISGELIDLDGQQHILGIIRDVTEHRSREELIWRQANYDTLTNLPNRRMFADRLASRIDAARLHGARFALLLIDLDHFKEVNDTLGHEKGDELLVQVAGRIVAGVVPGAAVARLGGDEFAIVLPSIDDAADTGAVLERLIAALSTSFALGLDRVFISASIGVAHYPDAGVEVAELLRHADQAMYAAKRAGRNRYCYFHQSLQDAAHQRALLTNGLRHALAGEQFALQYQPIFELATGRLHKAEALVRWHPPQRGVVSPAEFIPLAESSGLILEIGDWVFRQAVRDANTLRQMAGGAAVDISVNVSPVQFFNDADLTTRWLGHLADCGMPTSNLTLEITEGLLLDLSDEVRAKLRAFSHAGVQIALDDFGTGYSSLAYLRKFDIDYLKIDRAFVGNIDRDAEDLALCEAIVAMAHRLGLKVVVEGIETAAQLALMRAAGCDYAQGYYLGRPCGIAELETMVRAGPRVFA